MFFKCQIDDCGKLFNCKKALKEHERTQGRLEAELNTANGEDEKDRALESQKQHNAAPPLGGARVPRARRRSLEDAFEESAHRKLLREVAAAEPIEEVYVPPWRKTMGDTCDCLHSTRAVSPP